MGNKMCKKKVDAGDTPKSPSPFDRIFTRLRLKPNSWKSDSHLNTKQVNRYEINPKDAKNGSVLSSQPMSKSKSSDWTEAELEVPDKDEAIHLKNPQLSFIFNDNSTPTPPPRKHKKSIREKIESVAKNSIQVLQSKKSNDESKKFEYESKKPVDEPLCVKKIVHHGCPYCEDLDRCLHKNEKREPQKSSQKRVDKETKRKKNLSVVSLPNYSELKFSVANSEDSNLKYIDSSKSNSANSLPGEVKKSTTNATTGKLENYMTRCRSFGSLLNNKLKTSKEPADIESDDSFGGLEDWDLGILEHYNPKDASLPRPRKARNDGDMISDIEKLIVPEEEFEVVPPVRPVRRSESLIKKMNREAEEAAVNRSSDGQNISSLADKNGSSTPPPSPRSRMEEDSVPLISTNSLSTQMDEGTVEHSSLMRILQEYSIKDAQKRNGDDNVQLKQQPIEERISTNRMQSYATSVAPHTRNHASLNKRPVGNVTADFLNAEKESVS